MYKRIDKSSRRAQERRDGQHRFEHWYVDNQMYFLTARCRERFPAFASEEAKAIFWDRFLHYTAKYEFQPWVTTLLDNHYHCVGYLRTGVALKTLMQKLHGSVAKLVNDLLPERRVEFWRDTKGEEYFDGCLRDERQTRLAYRYTLTQSVRHGIYRDWRAYPHTRVWVEVDAGIAFARSVGALMEGVPYPRLERGSGG